MFVFCFQNVSTQVAINNLIDCYGRMGLPEEAEKVPLSLKELQEEEEEDIFQS